MNNASEQFAITTNATNEALPSIAGTLLSGIERMSALNFTMARGLVGDGSAAWRRLLTWERNGDLMDRGAAVQSSLERAIGYSSGVYGVLSETGADCFKETERFATELSRGIAGQLDELSKHAPPGTEAAVAAMNSIFVATTSAYESVTRSGKQAAESVHANISAAAQAGLHAAGAAVKATENGGSTEA